MFKDEFYLPFANRAAFDQLYDNAWKLIGRYMADYSSDLLRVWETERPFELHLESGIVNGRADVILDEEGGTKGALAIVDYKTASDAKADDVFAFQLAIYTAAGRGEGINVQSAYLHELKDSARHTIPVDPPVTDAAKVRANALIESIVGGQFPAKPEKAKCRTCDVRAVCKDAVCGKYDY
jgi:DNA helicase-2/ATP-dependent DNA helicase PcrA